MTGRELLAALDEELARLPARYREPLVLCYLEGLSRDEAALRLGVPAATVKTRLERGRRKLSDALTRRGCALGAGLTLAVTSPAGASPPRLVEAILAAVSGPAPASVAALARGVTVNALVNRSVVVLLAVVAVAWLGVGAWSARPSAAGAVLKADKDAPKKPNDSQARPLAGRVVGPDDRPVAGATIVLAGYRREEKTAREVARTAADGAFRCDLAAGRGQHFLVARAAGFAADWVEVSEANPARPIVLKLAKASVPIRGRVLTLEGKPVAGATVRLKHVQAPDGKNGLKEMAAKWASSPYEGAQLLRKRLYHAAAAGLPEKVKTGADGRFVLAGVGDGRLASLEFSGDTIETVIARVAVDAGFDPKLARFDPKKADPSTPYTRTGPPLYGSTFDHTARPCRPITGTVIDQKTKKPLPGVAVTGNVPGGWWEVHLYTRTDAAGRYRLLGLPNADCDLTFGTMKPAGYLMLTRTVGPTGGLTPATLDMPMVKGIVVTGRVTDRASGQPVKGGIRYATLAGNKHVLDLPGREIHGSGSMSYDLDADGKFEFVAPPGIGLIIVQTRPDSAGQSPYPEVRLRAADRGMPGLRKREGLGDSFITSRGFIFPLSGWHGYRVIDPAPGAKTLTADLQLDRGKAVAGKVVGPDGKPFTGATVRGLLAGYERTSALASDTFTAQAIVAEDNRTVAAIHLGKRLAGKVVIRGEKDAPVLRLAPWGAVTGRVVDADGHPVAGATVRMYFIEQAPADVHRHLLNDRATTGVDGGFRSDVPFAGVNFRLTVAHKGKSLRSTKLSGGFTVSAGKTLAVGDIGVKLDE
jgi:hypothetical protein